MTSYILAACGGFLLAVLWMDLMFDVQVLPHRQSSELPEGVLSSIAGYYRRVTTTARPMGHLVGAVMMVVLVTLAIQAAQHMRAWIAIVSFLLAGSAIGLGILSAFPNAVRLGARSGTALEQSELARSICRVHIVCFAAMLAFMALQLLVAAGVV